MLPKYITIDENGNEKEFLNDYFERPEDAINFVFQKGYQWPFDTAKIKGSSIIDMIIFNETVNKGNKVYMDFRNEPEVLKNGFECLSDEARSYLENSNALVALPIERLKIMNSKAIELYKTNGIDLTAQPLRVEVCAQHNNGGIAVDINWETNIKGLFAVGEVAGTFGVYRPGGTALNSTQVGSLRAAEEISMRKKDDAFVSDEELVTLIGDENIEFIFGLNDGKKFDQNISQKKEIFTQRMSSCASYIRIPEKMESLYNDAMKEYTSTLSNFSGIAICNAVQIFKLRDMILSQACVLYSMLISAKKIGTRGGALVVNGELNSEDIFSIDVKQNTQYDDKIVKSHFTNEGFFSEINSVKPIPTSDLWFEKVWNEYLERRKKNG